MSPELQFAISLAQEAGEIMRQNFHLGMKKEWKEADNSPLTSTDIAINNLVIERVKMAYPDHGVLGEEASFPSSSQHVWVVDPVDGTIPFSYGVPTFVFSLALVVDGAPQVGVIYDAMLDRLLSAEKGSGAFLNDKPTQVSSLETLNRTTLNIDGPWTGPGAASAKFFALLEPLDTEGAYLTKFSCMGYGGAMVGIGEYSAALCNGKFPWDIAALKVIIEEAGGTVTDLHGEEQRYDQPIFGAIISNGKVHQQLVNITQKSLQF